MHSRLGIALLRAASTVAMAPPTFAQAQPDTVAIGVMTGSAAPSPQV